MQVGQGVEENLAGLSGKGSPRQRLLVLRPEKRRGGVGVRIITLRHVLLQLGHMSKC